MQNNDILKQEKDIVCSNGMKISEMTEYEYSNTDQGLDDVFSEDWYLVHGKSMTFTPKLEESLKKVSNNFKEEKQKTLNTDRVGFKCLGYKEGINYLWSNLRQCLCVFQAKDLKQENYLNYFGLQFLKDKYQKYNSKGEASGFDNLELSGDIIDGCIDKGVFNLKNMHGFGIFVDPSDSDHLIINGSEIWGTNPNFTNSRVFGKNIYANLKDLDLPKNTPQATLEEFNEWFDLLGTWNYKRGRQDQLLIFGWTIAAAFAGVLNWRTHFSLTGQQGTGKSTQQLVIGNFLGEFAIVLDGQSTEAGIRQKVASSSCAVLIDEAESNSDKIGKMLTFFRTASSSGVVAKGTTDQSGLDFQIKLVGMLGGIVPPQMEASDLSRFLRIELLTKSEKIHPLLKNVNRQNEIGKKCIKYIIDNYALFKKVCKLVRAQLEKNLAKEGNSESNSRYMDTFTVLIACAYLGLNQNDDVKNIEEFIKQFNFEKERTAMQTKDQDILLNKLLQSNIKDDDLGNNDLINYINMYAKGNKDMKNHVRVVLGKYGFKLDVSEEYYTLYIATKNENLKKLTRYSKFESGDLLPILSRLKNSCLMSESVMIGSIRQARNTVIKIDLDKNDYCEVEEESTKINLIKNDESITDINKKVA